MRGISSFLSLLPFAALTQGLRRRLYFVAATRLGGRGNGLLRLAQRAHTVGANLLTQIAEHGSLEIHCVVTIL
jgi:hypothetical protein